MIVLEGHLSHSWLSFLNTHWLGIMYDNSMTRRDMLISEDVLERGIGDTFQNFLASFWKATQGLIRESTTTVIDDYVLLMPTIARYDDLCSLYDLRFQQI